MLFQPRQVLVPIEPSEIPFDLLDDVVAAVGIDALHIIAVVPGFERITRAMNWNWGTVDGESREQYVERDLRHRLEGYVYQDIPLHIAFGEPCCEILAVARKVDADLIVMTTHQRTGVSRLLNGSIAERLVRSSHIPVLISPLHPQPVVDAPEFHPTPSTAPAGHRGGW